MTDDWDPDVVDEIDICAWGDCEETDIESVVLGEITLGHTKLCDTHIEEIRSEAPALLGDTETDHD